MVRQGVRFAIIAFMAAATGAMPEGAQARVTRICNGAYYYQIIQVDGARFPSEAIRFPPGTNKRVNQMRAHASAPVNPNTARGRAKRQILRCMRAHWNASASPPEACSKRKGFDHYPIRNLGQALNKAVCCDAPTQNANTVVVKVTGRAWGSSGDAELVCRQSTTLSGRFLIRCGNLRRHGLCGR